LVALVPDLWGVLGGFVGLVPVPCLVVWGLGEGWKRTGTKGHKKAPIKGASCSL